MQPIISLSTHSLQNLLSEISTRYLFQHLHTALEIMHHIIHTTCTQYYSLNHTRRTQALCMGLVSCKTGLTL